MKKDTHSLTATTTLKPPDSTPRLKVTPRLKSIMSGASVEFIDSNSGRDRRTSPRMSEHKPHDAPKPEPAPKPERPHGKGLSPRKRARSNPNPLLRYVLNKNFELRHRRPTQPELQETQRGLQRERLVAEESDAQPDERSRNTFREKALQVIQDARQRRDFKGKHSSQEDDAQSDEASENEFRRKGSHLLEAREDLRFRQGLAKMKKALLPPEPQQPWPIKSPFNTINNPRWYIERKQRQVMAGGNGQTEPLPRPEQQPAAATNFQ